MRVLAQIYDDYFMFDFWNHFMSMLFCKAGFQFHVGFEFTLIVVMIVIRMGFQKDAFSSYKDVVLFCVL